MYDLSDFVCVSVVEWNFQTSPRMKVCSFTYVSCHFIKGELNLDKKWQSDDLFYTIMNEIHRRLNQFCVILKLS